MSRIIDNLKKIQHRRENGYESKDSSSPAVDSYKTSTVIKKTSKNTGGNWFVPIIFALFILVTFALNLKLFLMMKDYRQERELAIKKVSEIVDLLEKKNKVQSEAFSQELKLVNKQNVQLKEELGAQKVSVENLTKAKNVLYKRISALEAQLEQLKK